MAGKVGFSLAGALEQLFGFIVPTQFRVALGHLVLGLGYYLRLVRIELGNV